MRYPGGKGQAGVYQRIISLMPPHDVYIESHAGGANILERKRPAAESYAVDLDPAVCKALDPRAIGGAAVVNGDAAQFLRSFNYAGRRVLVYADPPYVMATRKSGRLYRFEYSDEQHHELLDVLRSVPALVMVSGYRCPMYDAALARWNRIDYDVLTRGGTWAVESLWFNFEPPAAFHDPRYVGDGFRDRWRMKKKRRRWRAMLERMTVQERAAMLDVLLELAAPGAALSDRAGAALGVPPIAGRLRSSAPAPARRTGRPDGLEGRL